MPLFGTDGVRGIANTELTAELVTATSRAFGTFIGGRGSVVVGRDRRWSGGMVEAAVVAGLCSAGLTPIVVGTASTPAVGFLVRALRAEGGLVATASHNLGQDNGLKLFSREGLKLPAEAEREIELLITNPKSPRVGTAIGVPKAQPDLLELYQRHLREMVGRSLEGLRVVIDCAGTAAAGLAPHAFQQCGAEVAVVEPIVTDGSGAIEARSIRRLTTEVVRLRADMGVAFDGDGDRLAAVDARGRVYDGDGILAVLAIHAFGAAALRAAPVVTTTAGNIGLERALEPHGIRILRTGIGDRAVSEAMVSVGATLGGEWSGHITVSPHTKTSDGLIAALKLAMVVAGRPEDLHVLGQAYLPMPEALLNVPVARREDLDSSDALRREIESAEQALGGSGVVKVWASGTEPVVRVKVQAETGEQAKETAFDIASSVKRWLDT